MCVHGMFKLCCERRPLRLSSLKSKDIVWRNIRNSFVHDKSSLIYNPLMYREPMELIIKKSRRMRAFWLEMNETGCIILEFLKADEIFLGNAIKKRITVIQSRKHQSSGSCMTC